MLFRSYRSNTPKKVLRANAAKPIAETAAKEETKANEPVAKKAPAKKAATKKAPAKKAAAKTEGKAE